MHHRLPASTSHVGIGIDSLSVSYHNQQALFLSILFSTILWSSRAWCVIVSMLPYFRRLRPSVVFIYFRFVIGPSFVSQTDFWMASSDGMHFHACSINVYDGWLVIFFFFFQIWEPPDLSIVGQERGRCIVHWPSILEKTLMNVTASNFPWLRGRQEEDKKKRIKRGGRPRGLSSLHVERRWHVIGNPLGRTTTCNKWAWLKSRSAPSGPQFAASDTPLRLLINFCVKPPRDSKEEYEIPEEKSIARR